MRKPNTLATLTSTALLLPGLAQLHAAHAFEDDSVDFQYSHYQEGRRDVNLTYKTYDSAGNPVSYPVKENRHPIEVDSLHGGARVNLSDRIKFAFNYTEDTWSGATPLGSAPATSSANNPYNISNPKNPDGPPLQVGASPFAKSAQLYIDKNGTPMERGDLDYTTLLYAFKPNHQIAHVMSYASPETRKQGDFKLSYAWDEAAVDIGGGISTERDYESRFVNLGGRMDFNQKQTTVNLGLSYTHSNIDAVMDPSGVTQFQTSSHYGELTTDPITGLKTLHGIRQDWAVQLGLTQVVNRDAMLELGMGYTRNTGFLENPYKLSWMYSVDPKDPTGGQSALPPGISYASGLAFVERRPDERNQWHWQARWAQYIEPLDAALHVDYRFSADDWGINAHTFNADWVQPLGAGWTVTPTIRYYTQEAADFYQPYFIVPMYYRPDGFGIRQLPANFSSDQRLSGYGTLSGGITVAKEFAKGVRLETGFEYYTHQGSLKLGGGGEGSFADFDYWVANAALKVNLDSLVRRAGEPGRHGNHAEHANVPAGVLFGHTLEKAGDMMVGYRYMYNRQAGGFLQGDHRIDEAKMVANGCPGVLGQDADTDFDGIIDSHSPDGCPLLPKEMTMSMHMLDIMYAPTDWLTLMLMPQFVDMAMPQYEPAAFREYNSGVGHGGHSAGHLHNHETGGIGDTGMYALVKLFDRPSQHLHASLGFIAPTGDVGIKLREHTGGNGKPSRNLDGAYTHYGMQLGSGTWDFKPSLTYTGMANAWSWAHKSVAPCGWKAKINPAMPWVIFLRAASGAATT